MLAPHRSFAELTFHVLAHVRATAALPASLFDPAYVRWCEEHLGPAAERPLGEDVAALAALLPTHQALARAQLTATLFDDADEGGGHAHRDLATFCPAPLLVALRPILPAVELLRTSAELERPRWRALPPLEPLPVQRALAQVLPCAPALAQRTLTRCRALGRRGRAMAGVIWVGTPERAWPQAPSAEHVAWQAAHEATLSEVVADAPWLAERDAESVALEVLRTRARRGGQRASHRRWSVGVANLPIASEGAARVASRLLDREAETGDD